MSKVKIYEIAKELNVDNKEVIDIANKLGIVAKTHSSSIEEADAKKVTEKLKSKIICLFLKLTKAPRQFI